MEDYGSAVCVFVKQLAARANTPKERRAYTCTAVSGGSKDDRIAAGKANDHVNRDFYRF